MYVYVCVSVLHSCVREYVHVHEHVYDCEHICMSKCVGVCISMCEYERVCAFVCNTHGFIHRGGHWAIGVAGDMQSSK